VCLSVIIMSLSCLALYFPHQAGAGAFLLFLGFVVAAGLAGLLMIIGRVGVNEDLERVLGLTMLLIGSYFMISALVLPQFGQIDRIYRLAAYSNQRETVSFAGEVWVVVGLVLLSLAGFFWGRRRAHEAGGRRPSALSRKRSRAEGSPLLGEKRA
jgi:predicted transporter